MIRFRKRCQIVFYFFTPYA